MILELDTDKRATKSFPHTRGKLGGIGNSRIGLGFPRMRGGDPNLYIGECNKQGGYSGCAEDDVSEMK